MNWLSSLFSSPGPRSEHEVRADWEAAGSIARSLHVRNGGSVVIPPPGEGVTVFQDGKFVHQNAQRVISMFDRVNPDTGESRDAFQHPVLDAPLPASINSDRVEPLSSRSRSVSVASASSMSVSAQALPKLPSHQSSTSSLLGMARLEMFSDSEEDNASSSKASSLSSSRHDEESSASDDAASIKSRSTNVHNVSEASVSSSDMDDSVVASDLSARQPTMAESTSESASLASSRSSRYSSTTSVSSFSGSDVSSDSSISKEVEPSKVEPSAAPDLSAAPAPAPSAAAAPSEEASVAKTDVVKPADVSSDKVKRPWRKIALVVVGVVALVFMAFIATPLLNPMGTLLLSGTAITAGALLINRLWNNKPKEKTE